MDTRRANRPLHPPIPAIGAMLLLSVLAACSPGGDTGSATGQREPRDHLVEISEARLEDGSRTSVHTGTLSARRTLRVFTREEGRITRLDLFEGDPVRAGEVLLELDDTLLAAELAKATAERRQAELDLERLEGLAARKLVAEDETARIRTRLAVARAEESILRARLGYTVERAPFDGIVTARLAEPGDAVARHSHVLTVSDPNSLVTYIDVSELTLPLVRVDDVVQVRIDALGRRPFPGRVSRIHPTLDPRSRQGTVEVTLAPVPEGAVAGQFCRVELSSGGRQRLLVPFRAVRQDRDGEYVFQVLPERKAQRVSVRTGERLGEQIEILDGLSPGDAVVLRGFLGLRDGLEVRVVQPGESAAAPGA